MKKLFKKIATFFAALLMVFGLASCDKSGSIKKAYEKADYTVKVVEGKSDEAQTVLKTFLTEEQMKDAENYDVIIVNKALPLPVAVVIKFPSSGDVKDFLTVEKDGKKDTSNYDKAKEDGTINGNCLLLTLSSDAKDIFKKA